MALRKEMNAMGTISQRSNLRSTRRSTLLLVTADIKFPRHANRAAQNLGLCPRGLGYPRQYRQFCSPALQLLPCQTPTASELEGAVMDLGIKGRKAIINGASAGMGKHAAIALAQAGVEL